MIDGPLDRTDAVCLAAWAAITVVLAAFWTRVLRWLAR